MAELDLIAAIREALGAALPGRRVVVGSGDDAAVVRASGVAVTSIDTVVDGVHFELCTHSAADVGHKALATALSDLAAMGAGPGEAYVSLALPRGFDGALELVAAMAELAARLGVTIAGGDVVSSPVLSVCVSVTGWAASESELVLRSGARPGDLVGVTGTLGGAGAGLMLLREPRSPGGVEEADELIRRHRRPEPLIDAGRALSAAGASAMIDVSDGLATDAAHIARASGVALDIRLADLPLAPGLAALALDDPHAFAATAGDDYELLFTIPPDRRDEVTVPVSWLGDVRAGAGVSLRAADGTIADLSGYEHA